jgi:hypothetical protein
MSTRELAHCLINELPDEKIDAFLTLFADENAIARMETDLLANDPNAKRYSDLDEMFKELDDEDI